MPVGRLGYGVGNVRCVMCVPFTFTFVLPRLLPGLFMELVEEACDIVVGLWHAWQHGHGHGHLQGEGGWLWLVELLVPGTRRGEENLYPRPNPWRHQCGRGRGSWSNSCHFGEKLRPVRVRQPES